MILNSFIGILAAVAVSFASLRQAADGGVREITEDWVLEGRIISEPANPNLDLVVQRDFRTTSHTLNNRTAYIQDLDGSLGFKLVFQHLDPEARKLLRYSRVKIALKGSRLSVNGPCYSLEDIPNDAVLEVGPGSPEDIPVKIRKVREILPEDMYTWIRVKDCEFAFKGGSYCNILESYSTTSPDNPSLGGNGYMGSWQTLLCDSDASPFYVMINARVPWRRPRAGAPDGRGDVEGICVQSYIPRYGKVFVPQIRPMGVDDFHIARDGGSAFKTICEWNWNDNRENFRTDKGEMPMIHTEKILPDIGEGRLYVDFPASVYRGRDCDNPLREDPKHKDKGLNGQVTWGSMQLRTMAKNWWNWNDDCGNSVVVKFSTEGLSGERLLLAFTFAAGDNSANNTRMCPARWGVEVSTDDVNIARVDVPAITLRGFPWFNGSLDGVQYYTSFECGMGLTEHIVVLPSSLFGQKEVYVRISPSAKNAITLGESLSDNGALRPNVDIWTSVEFGTIAIRYK